MPAPQQGEEAVKNCRATVCRGIVLMHISTYGEPTTAHDAANLQKRAIPKKVTMLPATQKKDGPGRVRLFY
jgi:hypothetical protein